MNTEDHSSIFETLHGLTLDNEYLPLRIIFLVHRIQTALPIATRTEMFVKLANFIITTNDLDLIRKKAFIAIIVRSQAISPVIPIPL